MPHAVLKAHAFRAGPIPFSRCKNMHHAHLRRMPLGRQAMQTHKFLHSRKTTLATRACAQL